MVKLGDEVVWMWDRFVYVDGVWGQLSEKNEVFWSTCLNEGFDNDANTVIGT